MRKLRKWLHLLLVICLIAGSILPYLPAMKLTVSAQETNVSGSGEGTTTTVNKIYVDGVGSGQKDGTSKDNAFATLVDALKAVPSNNVETYIIVCGEINVIDGATAYDTGTSRYILPQHAGKVIITSVYGTEGEEGYENYKSKGDLNFNKKDVFLLGETKFEHIRISTSDKKANIIFANFFPLHFGEGIECTSKVAETIDMGTRTHESLNSTVQTWLKKEQNVQLTIDSGVYGNVYGGSYNYQPSTSSAEKNHTVITVNGGEITGKLYGTGANKGGGNPPNNNVSKHKSVSLNVNGGTINELYAMDAAAIVSGDINLNLRGGTINKLTCIGDLFPNSSANNAPDAQSGIKVTIAGTTVSEFGASAVNESAKGTYQLHYDGSALTTGNLTATMSGVNEFTEWKLTGTSLSVAGNAADSWANVPKIEMTDDSTLNLAFAPSIADTKVLLSLNKSNVDGEWITGSALITAPAGTTNMFSLTEPLDHKLAYTSDTNGSYWTLENATAPTPTYVAQIGNKEYATLQEAIEAAESAESATEDVVITLSNDIVSNENLVVSEGITLDLNGNDLTASSAFSCGGNIVDNSEGKTGVLKVAKENCVLSQTNSQMPIYNGIDGYVFADITKQEAHSIATESDSTIFNLIFRPFFGSETTIQNALSGDSNGIDDQFKVILRLTWKDGTQDLVYTDTMVETVYAANSGKAFYINASGVTSFEGLTITPMVVSKAEGVTWSGSSFTNFSANDK